MRRVFTQTAHSGQPLRVADTWDALWTVAAVRTAVAQEHDVTIAAMYWQLGSKRSITTFGHRGITCTLVVRIDGMHAIHPHCTTKTANRTLKKIPLFWVPQNPILQTSTPCLIVQ